MSTGYLYIVATPIGNLADISQRALDVLKAVDLVAAEDTRHSGKLLAHFGIKKPMLSLHEYNETERGKIMLQKLLKGKNIALISDAGTPLISDPGYRLVKTVKKNNIPVIPIPGACAAITALCASGLPTNSFVFEGFLPAKTTARQKRLEELKTETKTLIFYETPHRLMHTIGDLLMVFGGNRIAVLARELTKKFETIRLAPLKELQAWLKQDSNQQKGEFVILIHGATAPKKDQLDEKTDNILKILLKELSAKQAAGLTAKITGKSKNMLYKLAMKLKV